MPVNAANDDPEKARRFRDAALPYLDDVYTLARYLLRESARIIAAPFSAIIAVGVLVLPDVIVGITEASATRKPAMP